MKLKLHELDKMYSVIIEISKQIPQTKHGSLLAFKLAKLNKKLVNDMDAYISARNTIVESYKDKIICNDDGSPKYFPDGHTRVRPEFAQAQLAEFNALALTEVEVDIDSDKVLYSELYYNYDLDVNAFIALMPIIIDDSENISDEE